VGINRGFVGVRTGVVLLSPYCMLHGLGSLQARVEKAFGMVDTRNICETKSTSAIRGTYV